MKKLFIFVLILMLPVVLFAQKSTISGNVTDANTGNALIGANVVIKGTNLGAASGMDGFFKIPSVPAGTYLLRASFMGYKMLEQEVTVTSGQAAAVNFSMEEDVIYGEAIAIVADRAKERETPVAFTNVRKLDMEQRLGSQDIPLILNTTPSVYSTMQGGGAGDARINVRGFAQQNVAIMINGVPINDMENGWLYWSNWDGVADATSSIQVQRGLSAVNLATPSIGGTMNVISDPTAQDAGVFFKQELGNDGFLKSTLAANSGLLKDKYAFNALMVRKVGDGVIDKTWTDAWAYYFGAAWNVNAKNRLEFYAIGAPQRHGQNSYMQNIGVYSPDFAKDLSGYDEAALTAFKDGGRNYNQNWAPVNSSYKGKQSWDGSTHDRYNENFINERENYYHKPLANLNWFTKWTDKLSQYTVLYYSGGQGGGSGTLEKTMEYPDGRDTNNDGRVDTYGGFIWNSKTPSRTADWDANIAMNAVTTDRKGNPKAAGDALAILRSSVNNQWTIGAISKLNYKFSNEIKSTVGIDWRTAEIEHYREVRDLLGGNYWAKVKDQFNLNQHVGLGEKVDYNFTNTVDWIGFFGQCEYSSVRLTTYGMAGYSTIKYSHTNFFKKDDAGNKVELDSDQIGGYQVKGGASYRFTSALNAYTNLGYVSKVPIFDQVISDRTSTVATDPKNEKFLSVEGGVNWLGLDNKLSTKLNLYYTTWTDRANSVSVQKADGSDALVFITGIDAVHMGAEFELGYQPLNIVRFDAAASIGNWKYLDDVSAEYKDYSNPDVDLTYHLYLKDIKVGDAPQTQFALVGSVFPVSGLMAQFIVRHYRDYYANFDPLTRNIATDMVQGWKVPAYTVVDFHAAYDLPFELSGIKLQLFSHVFNVLDSEYIQDAIDNSAYNAYTANGKNHSADDAEVFFGLPRTFNIGLQLRY